MALRKPAPATPLVTLRSRIDGSLILPGNIVRAAGLDTGELLTVYAEDGELRIVPAGDGAQSSTTNPIAELYDYFAPVRDEVLAQGISEEEINADIDAAIAEVRAEARARQR